MRRRLNSRAYDPFDEWLDSLGLYRKQLARDGSCLFRAVAEQVFMTQKEHERVRELCLKYIVLHREEFEPFLDIPLDHHVFKLQDCREWGGHLEIMAMSRLFNVNFLIYQEIGKEPYKATDNEGRTLMLSFTHGNHYDIVYKKEEASSRGFSQSLIYDILYSHVFKLKDVRLAVDTMLHDKEYASFRRDSANSAELKEIGALVEKILGTNISRDSQDGDKNVSTEEKVSLEDVRDDDVRGLLAHGIPPFPYKVAKSLDPDIYRNIEYDTWNTMRREARYGPFDFNGFQAGVKVLIKLDLLSNRQEVEEMRKAHMERSGNDSRSVTEEKADVFHGHIQEMSENKGPVDVYIEEIGSRLKVPYESLEKVPPSSPHNQGHGLPQQHHQASGVTAPGGVMPNYKKLSGYYQKAPLPMESEMTGGKRKNKGKPVREVLSLIPIPTPIRYCGPPHNCNMRGRSSSSPTSVGHSPRSRNSGGPHSSYNRNSGRGVGRNGNTDVGVSGSPSRDDFPSFSSSANLPVSLEGVWAVRPSANQTIVASTPKASSTTYCPATPQPPLGEDETRLQLQAVTDALQQVMSAGGQTVRVCGQQLEVVNSRESIEEQTAQYGEKTAHEEYDGLSTQEDGKVCFSSMNNDVVDIQPNCVTANSSGLEMVGSPPQVTQLTEDGMPQAPFYQADPSLAFMSTPPPSVTQVGCSSPQNTAMYTMACPPYGSPTYVQMITPVPPVEGTLTPSEVTPPPASTHCRSESIDDGNNNGSSSEPMKVTPGMSPVMVYPLQMMYGGYGYGYNQPFPFVPVMAPPNGEDGKSPPVPGSEVYPPVVPVSGWGSGVIGDMMMPPPPPPPVGPQSMPAYREPPAPPYPPPPPYHERPPYHQHQRGRGRGGPHHFNQQNRGHYNENSYIPRFDSMCRGGGQRPLPPRLRRGGGVSPGRGGPRYPMHHMNIPHYNNYQRNHQYEGQPLMQIGSRKSNSDNANTQVVPGGGSGGNSGGVSSPPLVNYMEDRPPGIYPLNTQDGSQIPPQEPMTFFPMSPGYVMGPPWMWMMM